jgi:glutamine amidotransferase
VGAFGEAMDNLKKMDLVEPIKDFVASGKPFMGVCLGLQLLFSESEEFGLFKGLDLVKGRVVKFPGKNESGATVKVPQIGWNQIELPKHRKNWDNTPLAGISPQEFMYFVHSYFVSPENQSDILSTTCYEGINYCSSILHNNIFASQFHPEKSASFGIKIYENWAKQVKIFKESK